MNWSTMINIPGFRSSFRDPTADIDTISVTPICLSASILALKLIFDGDIKCPLPCLGKKKPLSIQKFLVFRQRDLPMEYLFLKT